MIEATKSKTFNEIRAELRQRTVKEQKQINKIAIAHLKLWLADDSGYDEEVWPIVKAAIRENSLSERDPFDE